jgi:hypothetical protein
MDQNETIQKLPPTIEGMGKCKNKCKYYVKITYSSISW